MTRVKQIIYELGKNAKHAAQKLTTYTTEQKNRGLQAILKSIEDSQDQILHENKLDIAQARENNLSEALIERLALDQVKIQEIINNIQNIIKLSDPVGKLITSKKLANGIELQKIRAPIGVIGIIFESRPNVVVDVAALCIKSGNAVILRGGKEAQHTNRTLMKVINSGLEKIDFCPHATQLVPIQDREAVEILCRMQNFVDLIIPRGGENLIKAVDHCATVPVIKHYKGICHVYIDEYADITMGLQICENAKCQRPSVCNSIESVIIHQNISQDFLPKLYDIFTQRKVEIRGDKQAREICPEIKLAQEQDWSTEYLDLIINIKIIPDIDSAIKHINFFGSHHSDSIISQNKLAQNKFAREIDSACVYINASTRFTDGSVFGLGAEMGISTDKIHARGPMGLNELTTYKWLGIGSGQIRE